MKKFQRIAAAVMVGALVLGLTSMAFTSRALARPQSATVAFHFVYSADSRGDYTVLPDFSHKMVTLNPVFGFFGGDLCGTLDVTCIKNQWKPAMDGNNNDGMLARTFIGRGNHDSGSLSTWQGLWDFAGMATLTGATQFKAQTSDATYSFDYGNSHFVVVDNPSSGAAGWTSTQISWLDNDLAAAEARGMRHEFLFSHGPMYPATTQHASDQPGAALKAVLNKHPRLIGFHGHEHITTYTHVTPSFSAGINAYEQFVMGRAGAPVYSVSKPVTWKANANAFADIGVSDGTVTVRVFGQQGSLLYTKSFSHSAAGAPTPTPAGTTGGTGSVTYVSTAAYDGYVLETSEASSLGGTVNSTGTVFRLGDDASNRQYRAVLSFNTSGLPDNAVITAVGLNFKQAGSGGSNPFNSMGNILGDFIAGSFSNSTSLQAADFQAAASMNGAVVIGNTPSNGWYTGYVGLGPFGFINKTGVTQVRLRFATDDNNNSTTDYLSFSAGEAGTAANRPTLTIQYSLP